MSKPNFRQLITFPEFQYCVARIAILVWSHRWHLEHHMAQVFDLAAVGSDEVCFVATTQS